MPRLIPPPAVGAVHAAHALLDGAHLNDTAAAAVVVGDLIRGNAAPAWSRLGIGAAGNVLTVVAGLPAWAAPAAGNSPWGLFAPVNAKLALAAHSLTLAAIPAADFLLIMIYAQPAASDFITMIFNGDAANNYAWRQAANGAFTQAAAQPSLYATGAATVSACYCQASFKNIAAEEKVGRMFMGDPGTAGAANLPNYSYMTGKWANVVNRISSITITRGGAGNLNAGAEIMVWGQNLL